MRILPVSADSTAVEFSHDIQLGGYTIPARTNIWTHTYTTHNSPRYWDEPERFLPERFLQPGAEYASAGPLGRQPAAEAAAAEGTAGKAAAAASSPAAAAAPAAACSSFDSAGSTGTGGGWMSPPRRGSVDGSGGSGGDAAASTAGAIGRRAAAGEPLRFFPFSQGARDCVGQSLARLNYTATLAALLGRFSFRLATQAAGPGGVRDVVKLTLQPENGILMHAAPRVPPPSPAAAPSS
ncbi:hypothetical protein ABPG75_011891 [Micractinium tetrahymenae]